MARMLIHVCGRWLYQYCIYGLLMFDLCLVCDVRKAGSVMGRLEVTGSVSPVKCESYGHPSTSEY